MSDATAPLQDRARPVHLAFWAKWGGTGDTRYHPLACHAIDVGMAALALYECVLSRAQRQVLARSIGLEHHEAARWLAFLAATHDTGKASPSFQFKVEHPALRILLRETGLAWSLPSATVPHGTISAEVLPAIFARLFDLPPSLGRPIAVAVGGHHGTFPNSSALRDARASQPSGGPKWQALRLQLVADLARVFQVVALTSRPDRVDPVALVVFAGFVSVADWIGSNQAHFPPIGDAALGPPELDLEAYAKSAHASAIEALAELGWSRHPPPSTSKPFRELFDFDANDVQEAARAAARAMQGRGLAIIEAPTGVGKTEAALTFADLQADAGARGLYVALPTQATSNQLFSRLASFLARRYPGAEVQLQLLHGHADLHAEFDWLKARERNGVAEPALPKPEGLYEGNDEENARAALFAASWFTHRKRGLLAPFGVGTIDQVLLAALRCKHMFVRLYGLAGKTVIIDEVHAYDAYMSDLLGRLLAWLGAMGSPVILLSATLPASRRLFLLSCYAQGAGFEAASMPLHPYPRISWSGPDGPGGAHLATPSHLRRTVHIEWMEAAVPDGKAETGAAFCEVIMARVAEGGCQLVLCNTVSRAQAIFAALHARSERLLSEQRPELDLLHARFPYNQRAEIEARCLRRFGKPGPDGTSPNRPFRAILVATQIVEQSLDLDFDAIVTEMAPIDLLLQRMGRLWRHVRPRRPGQQSAPVLTIVAPRLDAKGRPRFGGGTEAVYAPHLLLRSWLVLRGRQEIVVPADIEDAIEAVYGDDVVEPPKDESQALQDYWNTTRGRMEQVKLRERNEAAARIILAPEAELGLGQLATAPVEEDRPDLHRDLRAVTRLAAPSIVIVCASRDADGRSCLPDGTRVVTSAKPDRETSQALLQRSVSISLHGVVEALTAVEVPSGWRDNAWLKDHRLVVFDETASFTLPNSKYTLQLDPLLGLVVEKEGD